MNGKITETRKKCNNLLAACLIGFSRPKYGIHEGTDRDREVIVSLTSYPARFNSLPITIKSILRQSVKADKIILYLNEEEGRLLPQSVLSLTQYGLSIRYRKENLKPHKKYFYAMLEHPDSIIITIDDDAVYEKNMIRQLLSSYQSHPDCISAKMVHQIKVHGDTLCPYSSWDKDVTAIEQPSLDLLAVGVGGILYPPHLLPEKLFDKELILRLCLNMDDLWLKFMEVLNGVPVVFVKGKYSHPRTIPTTQKSALKRTNVLRHQNDQCIQQLERALQINLADLISTDK